MTYAAVPALRHQPELAAQWVPKALSTKYDPQLRPLAQKNSVTLGMAMTEKQGGSDVRANTTRAFKLNGDAYRLVGHKWFCSAPMSDAFLTLAYTDRGLSCFLVPRITPDGRRNAFHIQRLKDKLGNRSNASSEIEYHDTWAVMVGEEGRGVPTIIDMVHHTRLDCTIGAAGTMRMALAQALHHTRHRRAFQKTLVDQPLMRAVLADLALESEAGTALTLRIARAFDESSADADARGFARLAVAVGKYWLNKRLPNFVYECMECHGGVGYVEESPMPRLYREAPLNSIWEGSGNVICLDILRTLQKEPRAADAFFVELDRARGGNAALDRAIDELKDKRASLAASESSARLLTERMALVQQGALLVRHAPSFVADAFCATRLGGAWGRSYGTLPPEIDAAAIIARAAPAA
jgi:putative acyl-CoA dehydrogenase